jgi:hypothetical protein
MAIDVQDQLRQAHAWLDRLPPAKLGAVLSLLEVMVDDENAEEALTEEDKRALRASNEHFLKGGMGVPFEQVVADLGLTMEAVRSSGSSGVE